MPWGCVPRDPLLRDEPELKIPRGHGAVPVPLQSSPGTGLVCTAPQEGCHGPRMGLHPALHPNPHPNPHPSTRSSGTLSRGVHRLPWVRGSPGWGQRRERNVLSTGWEHPPHRHPVCSPTPERPAPCDTPLPVTPHCLRHPTPRDTPLPTTPCDTPLPEHPTGGLQHLAASAAPYLSTADISSFRDVSGALSRSLRLINSQTSCSSNCFNLFAYGWGRGETHVAPAAVMGTIWKPFIIICCTGAGGGRKDFY